jgi:hypothetical protein
VQYDDACVTARPRAGAETKPAVKTTEFVAYVLTVAAVLISSALVGDIDGRGDVFLADQAWLYVTLLTIGFMISRGLAKAAAARTVTPKSRIPGRTVARRTVPAVAAEVLLEARLDNVARIIDRVLTTIDNNPAIVGQLTEPVGQAAAEVGAGTSDVVDDVVTGAGSAIAGVGEPGKAAVGEVGKGAAEIVEDLGQGIANADADLAEDAFPQPPAKEPESARRSRPRAAPSAAGGPRKGPRRPRDRGPEED